LSVAWVPVVAAGALGSVAGFESLVLGAAAPSCPCVLGAAVDAALPLERDALSSAQAPSSNPAAPSAAQSQSLFVVMRCLPPVEGLFNGSCERPVEKRRGEAPCPSDLPETGRQTR
jgi:hypothetical protein